MKLNLALPYTSPIDNLASFYLRVVRESGRPAQGSAVSCYFCVISMSFLFLVIVVCAIAVDNLASF